MIIVIMETHFKVRHKYPSGYIMIGRSLSLNNEVGRGGVAIYIKHSSDIKYNVYNDVPGCRHF